MASGDPQRVWFSEMLDELERWWSHATSWEELADFCARMTRIRRRIRQERGIQPPRPRCPKCGQVSQSDIAGITIRSALFALKKRGVITDGEFKELDRSWMMHKKKHGLDPYGTKAGTPSSASVAESTGSDTSQCGHET